MIELFIASTLFCLLAVAIGRGVRLRTSRSRLAYWQTVLILFIVVPLVARYEFGQFGHQARFRLVAVNGTAQSVSRLATGHSSALLTILLAGCAMRIGILLIGAVRLRVMRRQGMRVAVLAGAQNRIELVMSRTVSIPASYGARRPVILVPSNWPSLPESVQLAVLAHEREHIRRRDWPAHIFEEFLLAFLWFHPAVYVLVRKVRLAREEAVDAVAVHQTSSPSDYLRALLAFVSSSPAWLPAPSFSSASQLKHRVESLHQELKMSQRHPFRSAVPAFALLAAAAALTVFTVPLRSTAVSRHDAQNGDVYKVGDDVQAPHVISKIEPRYTQAAKDAGVQGTAVFNLVIDKQGQPHDIHVFKSLRPDLDDASIAAIQQWRFEPATRKGEPVAVDTTIEIRFTLK